MSQDLEILVICSDLTVARFRCYGLGWRSKYAGLLDVLNNLLTKHVERLWDWRSERDFWWFSLTWILSWFVLLLINMWNNNTLIDTWFVLTHRKTMIFWITVYWMLLFVNVVSGAPPSRLCHCFIVFMSNLEQVLCTLNDYTITLMSWFIFILYVFALYYIVCMYPLYTTCALLLFSIVWLKYVFPCVLLVDNYVSLNQCDLNFHFFLNVTLMICMVKLACSFDFIDFCTSPWFVLMI